MVDRPRPRQVGAVAVRADHVGVERQHVARSGDVAGALLIPRVGALAGDTEPRLDPLAAGAGVLVVELGPDLLLGVPGDGVARTSGPCPPRRRGSSSASARAPPGS